MKPSSQRQNELDLSFSRVMLFDALTPTEFNGSIRTVQPELETSPKDSHLGAYREQG